VTLNRSEIHKILKADLGVSGYTEIRDSFYILPKKSSIERIIKVVYSNWLKEGLLSADQPWDCDEQAICLLSDLYKKHYSLGRDTSLACGFAIFDMYKNGERVGRHMATVFLSKSINKYSLFYCDSIDNGRVVEMSDAEKDTVTFIFI